jgi:hypothetical protein
MAIFSPFAFLGAGIFGQYIANHDVVEGDAGWVDIPMVAAQYPTLLRASTSLNGVQRRVRSDLSSKVCWLVYCGCHDRWCR